VNRVVADVLSDFIYPPTPSALRNLERESVAPSRIGPIGDVMIDAVLTFGSIAQQRSMVLRQLGLTNKSFVAVTIHRAENTDDPVRLSVLCQALGIIAQQCPVVFPCHPRTVKRLSDFGLRDQLGAVQVVEPVGFFDMLELERGALCVVSDSGGVHKEAFAFGTASVIARNDVWWPELVESGWVVHQPPTDVASVVGAIEQAMALTGAPDLTEFGGGTAATNIAAHLRAALINRR
jgi:UDP-GlcNAc3NAcA epimerase